MSPGTTKPEADARVLLLVEDNPGDAELVIDLLEQGTSEKYEVLRAERLDAAVRQLALQEVDAILLDLRLPDAAGPETVAAVRKAAGEVPIIVLTGMEDDELALECVNAGADDFLQKGEMRARPLQRAIGYAVYRRREGQLRALKTTLEQYRSLVDAGTSVTAALSGVGLINDRSPDTYRELTQRYIDLLETYLDQLILERPKPHDDMERLVTEIGDAGGGPRDVIRLHGDALERSARGRSPNRGRALAVEGRLLALEMMGLLVDYYRVGIRRRFTLPSRGNHGV